jgi:diaminopimelate epimerase
MNAGAGRPFTKMHGAGNDFVLLDCRGGAPLPDAALARALGDRHRGVGFDQLLTIEDATQAGSLARYRIWNADGSPAQQCGNGARCVAAWLVRDGAATTPTFRLDSPAGPIDVVRVGDDRYQLAMGLPEFAPERIPFAADARRDEYALATTAGEVRFGAVSMGNPHAVVFVDDVAATDLATLGPAVQARSEFAEGVNVGIAQVLTPSRIRLRVFERGAGETLACGSGACAAVAVGIRQGRLEREVAVDLPGGTLLIRWPDDRTPLTMAGPVAFVFEGRLAGSLPC